MFCHKKFVVCTTSYYVICTKYEEADHPVRVSLLQKNKTKIDAKLYDVQRNSK